jgi:hypothetical protein
MKKTPPPKKKVAAKPYKPTTADDHRKAADKLRARSMMHEAKASLLDVDEPPKKAEGRSRSLRSY